ncbi:hypothetical protein K2173_022303 [Erythroxylum novogranatense]|uniref:Uncharacterized protein n=1 Tax=Erythroxylum novogranatense TaxID=1862640 RepID=A0AAV8TJW8_9ROSI|nr:hypothetical protein K2173_022303 [Erythroxylum novogranatense]
MSLDNVLLERFLDDWIVEPEKNSMQEDEESLCSGSGIVYEDGYENQLIDYAGVTETAVMDDVESLDVDPAAVGGIPRFF